MRTWCLCALPQFLRLVLSAFHLLAVAASAANRIASRTSPGEPRPSAPTRSSASLGEAAKTHVRRSIRMDMAVRSLERLAICLGHRQTGNRHCLAPQGLSAVLDLESSSRSAWPTAGSQGRARADPQNELQQSTFGERPEFSMNSLRSSICFWRSVDPTSGL